MGVKPLQNSNENKTIVSMCSDSDQAISDQSSQCKSISEGVLGVVHSIRKIPTYLMNAWKNSTTTQKVMGISSVVYCTAATAYIIYLETQTNHALDCSLEDHGNSLFAEEFVEKGTQPILRNYSAHLSANLERCEKEFRESGAHESNPNEIIGMQVCYPLINKMCEIRESILRIMSKIPGKLNRDLANTTEVIEDLEYIRHNFFCEKEDL